MTITTPGNAAPRRGTQGAEAPLPLSSVPITIVIAASMAGPKIPAFVGDSWRPTAASVLALAPLAAVTAVSAMSLLGTASATPTLHADALTAHTTTTSGGTTPRPGTRGAWTPLPLATAPFTTAITGSVTDGKIPAAAGDLWAHAGSQATATPRRHLMTTMTSGGTAPRQDTARARTPLPLASVPFTTVIAGTETDPKIPAAVGDSWRPVAASLLGVAPLAAITAVSAISLLGTASAAPARHADASTAHPFTTVIAASMTDPKIPEAVGDL